MDSLKATLMRMNNWTEAEAQESIKEAKEILRGYLACGEFSSAEDICAEMWGLEPDYLMDLM